MSRWVILDRDGTVIVDKNYLHSPDDVELLNGAADGLKKLCDSGYKLIIVTNQSGIGRGYFTKEDMLAVNSRIDSILSGYGVKIEGWYFCPHTSEENCVCRKPKTGLVIQAMKELEFLANDIAFVIGDKKSDIELANGVNAESVLVMTGYGRNSFEQGVRGTLNCNNLLEAAEEIIKMEDKKAQLAKIFDDNIETHIKTLNMMNEVSKDTVLAASKIAEAFLNGGAFFICGNGGSSADAQHIAAEFSGRYLIQGRRPLNAYALSCNTSAVTAIGNDFGYNEIFARQIEAHGHRGDVLLAISTSGNSENILKAVEKARSLKIYTIGLTGSCGGKVSSVADVTIKVPSDFTPRIQEMHILVGHIICNMVEKVFFPDILQ